MNLDNILSNRQTEEDFIVQSGEIRVPTGNSFREYVVTVYNYEDLDQLYIDMENNSGDEFIPNRSVQRSNKRPLSRNTHYILTDEEAQQLKNDPRVWDVDLTLEEKGIVRIPLATYTYNVTANSGNVSNYVFSGAATGSGPTLNVVAGDVLVFNVNVSTSHPFWVKTAQVTGTGSGVGNGTTTGTITNNGASTGTITWNTTGVTPATYYYICRFHGNMYGVINVAAPSAPLPTYSVSPSTSSVNEGSPVTFTVTTTNVADGTTLYWTTNTISGTINASDFSDSTVSGSVSITSGTASIVRTLANDVTTEGSESFQLQIRTGSTSGTIVATSSTVTINDTSVPVPIVNIPTPIAGRYTGVTTSLITQTYNGYPVRGYLYYPTSANVGSSLDVVVLYHGTIDSAGVSPSGAASTFMTIARDQINIKDKLIFSVAYPQDAIPAWVSNPALVAAQFPGLNLSTLYFGDNLVYAEAALLWVKNNLNSYMATNNIPKTINRVFTFGHSQGAYLVHRLNTMHAVDGVISNAPGPIDLLNRCSGPQNTENFTCNKIRVGFGLTTANPAAYNTRSLKSYLSGTLSPTLFTQALNDDPYQVNLMQNTVQVGLNACTNCSTRTFNYYATGGHDAFVTNTVLQQDIRTFIGSNVGSNGTTITNGVFGRKSSGFTNTDLNWGLLAHGNTAAVSALDEAGTDYLNNLNQPSYSTWGSDRTGNATASVTIPFDGTNVDVVIVDDEVPPLHPEFALEYDGTGGSRVNEINWWSLYRSVVQEIDNDVVDTSVPTTYTYGDYGDHGTHVAGTAAGNRQGWARKANIYSLYAYDNTKVPPSLMYDLLRAFHLNKPVNATTGRRNPTITNHSYGYVFKIPITQITQFQYRGSTTNVAYTNTSSDLNLVKRDYGLYGGQVTTVVYGSYPTQSAQWSVFVPYRGGTAQQADIEDAINDGLIFVTAAGNFGDTSVDSSHPDYNNRIVFNYQSTNSTQTYTGQQYYYKQGTDPAAVPAAITVGNLDSVAALKVSVSSGDNDRVWAEFKSNSSSHGNTCDIWAAGTNIMSAMYTSQTLKDPRSTSYSIGALTGTSMASPQIAGMIACLAQRYPRFRQNDFLNLLKYSAYSYPRVFPGAYHKHYVTNTLSSSYNFASNSDRFFARNGPNVSFDIRIGEIMEFSVNTPGHPFWIKTLQVIGTTYAVTDNITGNGSDVGTIIWDTSKASPGIYYYICQSHSIMTGTITLRYSQFDRPFTAVGSRTQPYALMPANPRKSTGYVSPDVAESVRATSGLVFPRKRILQTP